MSDRSAIFKNEVALPNGGIALALFKTKWLAKLSRDMYGGTIRRGPEHRRGETGETKHYWDLHHARWSKLGGFGS